MQPRCQLDFMLMTLLKLQLHTFELETVPLLHEVPWADTERGAGTTSPKRIPGAPRSFIIDKGQKVKSIFVQKL